MKGLLTVLILMLTLSACGYHLVGQGESSGVIPKNASQIMVVATPNTGKLLTMFRQKLAQSSDVPVVDMNEAKDAVTDNSIEIRMEHVSEAMTASAFDASGIANQYRLTISASLRVLQSGKKLWESEVIRTSGNVFAAGGVVAIKAQKERVLQDLREEWVQKALGSLRSGF